MLINVGLEFGQGVLIEAGLFIVPRQRGTYHIDPLVILVQTRLVSGCCHSA